MAPLFDFVAEVAGDVLAALPYRRLGWRGVVVVGLIAIAIAVLVAIVLG